MASNPRKLDGRSSTLDSTSKVSAKPFLDGQHYLDGPLQDSFRPSLDTLSGLSTHSVDNEIERSTSLSSYLQLDRTSSRSSLSPKTWKGKWQVFWHRNKGLALVLTSQLFGGFMNVATRMLETGSGSMSPFQVKPFHVRLKTPVC